jgi:uncharacterized damage-inducible protein DinB
MEFIRREPPHDAPEKEMLVAFLTYHQQTTLMKIAGLNDEELRRSLVPSNLTLLGMVKHLGYVYRTWLQAVYRGENVPDPWTEDDPDVDFRIEPHETTSDIIAFYRAEIARANEIIGAASLDDAPRRLGRTESMRWILVHLIEEHARHNGQADILREQTDGEIGE